MKTKIRASVLFAFTCISLFGVSAEGRAQGTSDATPRVGGTLDRYQIAVLTYGPGSHPFTKFGHNAIWVTDRRTGEEAFYNFGTLDFESKSLITDFLKGRLRYWVSVTGRNGALDPYRANNRSATAQVLALSAPKKEELVQKLRSSALPENRFYIYDYYQDNCSTRVRDILDEAVDGRLREISSRPARWTWREHTMRLSQADLGVSLGLNLALGPHVDAKNTLWEEMFLPGVLQTTLRKVEIGDGEERRPLVGREYSILDSTRPPERAGPPRRWWLMLLSGATLGGLCLFLYRKKAALREDSLLSKLLLAGLGLTTLVWGLVAGALGTLLAFFWLGTNHAIAFRNQNILLFSPLGLLLPPLILALPFFRNAPRLIFWVSALGAASATLGLAIRLSPFSVQDTDEFVALTVPLWWGLALAWSKESDVRECPTQGSSKALKGRS